MTERVGALCDECGRGRLLRDGRHVVRLTAPTVDLHKLCGQLTDQCTCLNWWGDWPHNPWPRPKG